MDHVRGRWLSYLIAIVTFVTGTIAGAVAVKAMPLEQQQDLMGYLNKYIDGILVGNVQPAAWQSVLSANLQLVGLLWICGLAVVGVVGILVVLFLRGFIIGFSVGFLVTEMGTRAILFAAASVLPHNLLAVPLLIASGALGIAFSLRMAFGQKTRGSRDPHPVVPYSLSALVVACLMFVPSLLEAFVTPVFIKAVVNLF